MRPQNAVQSHLGRTYAGHLDGGSNDWLGGPLGGYPDVYSTASHASQLAAAWPPAAQSWPCSESARSLEPGAGAWYAKGLGDPSDGALDALATGTAPQAWAAPMVTSNAGIEDATCLSEAAKTFKESLFVHALAAAQKAAPAAAHVVASAPSATVSSAHAGQPGILKWHNFITTVMVRNIPDRYTPDEFLSEVTNSGFKFGSIDFAYLPMDFGTRKNRGYGFLNFITPQLAVCFRNSFHKHRLHKYPSHKLLVVSPADTQGLKENAAKYLKNQSSRVQNRWFKPMILVPDINRFPSWKYLPISEDLIAEYASVHPQILSSRLSMLDPEQLTRLSESLASLRGAYDYLTELQAAASAKNAGNGRTLDAGPGCRPLVAGEVIDDQDDEGGDEDPALMMHAAVQRFLRTCGEDEPEDEEEEDAGKRR